MTCIKLPSSKKMEIKATFTLSVPNEKHEEEKKQSSNKKPSLISRTKMVRANSNIRRLQFLNPGLELAGSTMELIH